MDEYFNLIRLRQSCRNFSGRPVEREKLIKCAEAARLAPSACNSQPWEFVAVTGGPLREKAAQCAQALGFNQFTQKCPAFVAAVEKTALLDTPQKRGIPDQMYAQFDLGLATMQFCLAATAQGLATCILGGVDKESLNKLLKVSGKERVYVLLAVGYAADASLRTKQRKSLDDVIRFAE